VPEQDVTAVLRADSLVFVEHQTGALSFVSKPQTEGTWS
jgi:hypothetical protein